MVAAEAKRGPAPSEWPQLRRITPWFDMGRVAQLIETSFAGELDQGARGLMREMRLLGRLGWPGYLLGRLVLPPIAYPDGFVWEANGEIVGNASLMPAGRGSQRWVLANVAVHPDHRRRGIARRMVLACIDRARALSAKELILQVGRQNQGAIDLYHQLDFEVLTTRTEWVRRAGLPPEPAERWPIRHRHRAEWRAQWALARQRFPEGIQWPYELQMGWFRPRPWWRGILSGESKHWVWEHADGSLHSCLTARYSRDYLGWRLALLAGEPEDRNAEIGLLRHALEQLKGAGMAYHLSYPWGKLTQVLPELGFRSLKSLTWMGLGLS